MLHAYGPGCSEGMIDPARDRIPEGATWLDLEQPTREEEKLVEKALGFEVPTRDEMSEIEPSSRLYERAGVLFMTMSVLYGVEGGSPSSEPVSFVLSADRLVTVRYVSPKPMRVFSEEVRRNPALAADPLHALIGLLDAIIDRLADELEALGAEIEGISSAIFSKSVDARRIPAKKLTALLTHVGRTQSLLARVRETAVSTTRLLSFLGGSPRLHDEGNGHVRNRLSSLATDVSSLIEHSSFLGDNLIFVLDASLGLISVEQNAAMKLFSWAALVFLPPTLIAGIYGMNFDFMPELHWVHGYWMALILMLGAAVLPLLYLKLRRWI